MHQQCYDIATTTTTTTTTTTITKITILLNLLLLIALQLMQLLQSKRSTHFTRCNNHSDLWQRGELEILRLLDRFNYKDQAQI